MFRSVGSEEFRQVLAECSTSPFGREIMARLVSFEQDMDGHAAIHDGGLRLAGSLTVPAVCTLITGDLDIGGVLDLRCETDYEGEGLFIVIGNVRCRDFIGEINCTCIVDGDLEASQSVVNDFYESGLWVVGTLRTRLFIGDGISAEVGAGAVMDYGVGCCRLIGYGEAEAGLIAPLEREEELARIVIPRPNPTDYGYLFDGNEFVDRIRAGQPIFR